jgi:hypothetical protein
MTFTKKALIVAIALNVLMIGHFTYSHIHAKRLCLSEWKHFDPQYSVSNGCQVCCGENGERVNPYLKILEFQRADEFRAKAAGGIK